MKLIKYFLALISAFGFSTVCAITLTSPEAAKGLSSLLQIFDIQTDGTDAGLVDATQNAWLRPAGKERWELEKTQASEKSALAFRCFKQIGMITPIMASKQEYQYAILMGATWPSVMQRINFLKEEWEKGIRFERIVILTSERPLDSKIEPLQGKLRTEADMIAYVLASSNLPSKLSNIPIDWIVVPMANGKRPTTEDTFNAWIKTQPKPGNCLIVSSQPYLLRQGKIAEDILPKVFETEIVGCGMTKEEYRMENTAVFLDELARLLYTINHPTKNRI